MPPQGIIDSQPKEVQAELARRLRASNHHGLEDHAKWLDEEHGVEVSVQTLGRWSRALKLKIEERKNKAALRLEIHRELGGLSSTEKAELLEVAEVAAYNEYLDLLDDFGTLPKSERIKALPGLIRAGAELGRASVGTAKWKAQVAEETRRKALEEAAGAAMAAGASDQTVDRIRELLERGA